MTFLRSAVAVLALILASACATSGRPANVNAPEVVLGVPSPVFFGSSATAPVTVEITVTNRARVPLTVQGIDLTSPGMLQYGIYPESEFIHQTLQPGETKTFTIFATAGRRVAEPAEPLTLRAVLRLEASGKTFTEIVTQTL
jgi:hypothetical protein